MSSAPSSTQSRVTLQIGVDQAFYEGGARLGYAGKVVDITPDRPPKERVSTRLVVPVGYGEWAEFKVPAGTYVVEAIAPSGALIDEEVRVTGEEGVVDVRLADGRSALENRAELAWQVMSGNIVESLTPLSEALIEQGKKIKRDADRSAREASESPAGRLIAPYLPLLLVLLGIFLFIRRMRPSGGMEPYSASGLPAWLLPLLLVVAGTGIFLMVRPAFRREAEALKARRGKKGSGKKGGADPETSVLRGKANKAEPVARVSLIAFPARTPIEHILHVAGELGRGAEPGSPGSRLNPLEPVLTEESFEKFSIDEASLGRFGGLGSDNLFMIGTAPGCPAHLIGVPLPWRSLDGGRPCPVDVLAGPAADGFASTIADPEFATLLGYLSTGQLAEAQLLAGPATRYLEAKVQNPFAAAAGAYVLLAGGEAGPEAAWREWVYNLNDLFPELPDGAVLQGWNRLQTAETDEDFAAARSLFLDAVERGIPVFSEGVRRLQSGLAMFAGEDADGRVARASEIVQGLAVRCHAQKPFTTLRLNG